MHGVVHADAVEAISTLKGRAHLERICTRRSVDSGQFDISHVRRRWSVAELSPSLDCKPLTSL